MEFEKSIVVTWEAPDKSVVTMTLRDPEASAYVESLPDDLGPPNLKRQFRSMQSMIDMVHKHLIGLDGVTRGGQPIPSDDWRAFLLRTPAAVRVAWLELSRALLPMPEADEGKSEPGSTPG